MRCFFFILIFFCSNTLIFSSDIPQGFDYIPIQESDKDHSAQSPITLVSYDLLIPGYGGFALGKPVWGTGFATAKIATFVLIYFTIKNYQFWNSVNNAVANHPQGQLNAGESSPRVLFQNPANENEYLSRRTIQSRADRAFLYAVYSVILELAIYGVSAWFTYDTASLQKTKSGPAYRMHSEEKEGVRIDLEWQQTF